MCFYFLIENEYFAEYEDLAVKIPANDSSRSSVNELHAETNKISQRHEKL